MSKAQVSMETFLTAGIIILIFISIIVVTSYLKRDIKQDEEMLEEKNLFNKFH